MGGKLLGHRHAEGFAYGDYEQTTARKRTKRERFLAQMESVVPRRKLIALIEIHYPKPSSKGGRPPYPFETMLRIHLMQQWYDLSDPAMEDALIEVPTMRRFAGIDLISERIPDETTILAFRHLLEKHDLGKQIFEVVKAHLKGQGMSMKQGTIIDVPGVNYVGGSRQLRRRVPPCHPPAMAGGWQRENGPIPARLFRGGEGFLIGTRRQSRWPLPLLMLRPTALAERTSRRTPRSAGSA
jgi:transposase, IS5 family